MASRNEGVEEGLDPHGEDQDADHLHHRDNSENPIICVVRAGKPGEIDPSPDDGEHREGEAEQARAEVTLGHGEGELASGDTERDDEGQVEEQLQWSGRPVILKGIPAAHAGHCMPEWIRGHGSGYRRDAP